jgi:hypothetical protein
MGDDVIAPFVTSIKIYLPLGDYKDVQKQRTITTTTITNDLGEDICMDTILYHTVRIQ